MMVLKPACKLRQYLMNDSFSSIWLEINLPRQKKFLVCHAYRDWQYLNQGNKVSKSLESQHTRWVKFLDQRERGLKTDLECLVLGDLNIDHTKWTQDDLSPNSITSKLKPLIESLFNTILPYGIVQCVAGPTRFESNCTPSGLDHFWTSNPNKLSNVHTYFHGSSDHKIIIGTRYTKRIIRSQRYIKKRSFKNFDPSAFIQAVKTTSWWELYSCDNPEDATEILSRKLNLILDEMAPIRKYQVRPKYAPWLTNCTKELMNERDLAQKRASRTGLREDWIEFKKLRNRINGKLKQEKKSWQSKRLENCSSTSDIWRSVKSWLGWNTPGPPSQLVINGELKNKPKDLADCMNSFFVNKVKDLRRSIPPCRKDPLESVRNLMRDRTCTFSLKTVHPDVVSKIIKDMKSSKTCGVDNIDSYVLKLVCDEITPSITHIVNLSIEQKHFPSLWKNSKVIPLFKKDDPTSPKNYRPVSLLPIASKILERVVYMQLIEYLEEKDKISAVVLLDMSAAFDLVDKGILINKLRLYGFTDESASWMDSYMSGRNQQVYMDGELSESLPVDIGVPQGSILGPILYCLLVNDLPEVAHDHPALPEAPSFWNTHCSKCGGITCFADDSSLSMSNKDPQVLNQEIKDKYKEISAYMASNRLVLNSDKTHLLVMASERNHKSHGNFGVILDTGTETILPQSHEKMLGCNISSNFSWNHHLRDDEYSLNRQLTSRINPLRKISYSASFATRKMIANGIVLSRIIYVIQIWGGTHDYLLKMLQILQNKAARFVTNLDIFTSQAKLLQQCGWLSVK